MAAEEDIKKLFIQVESEDTPPQATTASSTKQTESDFLKEEFRSRLDDLAREMMEGSAPAIPSDLPSYKGEPLPSKLEPPSGPDENAPTRSEAEAAFHEEAFEDSVDLLDSINDLAGNLPEIEAALEKANKLLQEIANELDDATIGTPPGPVSATDESTGGVGGAGNLATAAAVSQLDSPAPGPADVAALAIAAGGAGGGDVSTGIVSGDPFGNIVVGLDSIAGIAEAIVDAIFQVDEHILSLADDIRAYSADVQVAEVEAQITQMEAMIRRSNEIGPLLGDYIRERAILDAEITDLVTEIESKFLPLALIVLEEINSIGIPALEELAAIIRYWVPQAALTWIEDQRKKREDDFNAQAKEWVDTAIGFLNNKKGGAFGADKNLKDKFPLGAGIFF